MVTCNIVRVGEYENSIDRSNIVVGRNSRKIINLNQNFSNIDLEEGFEQFRNRYQKERLQSLLAYIEKMPRNMGQTLKEVVKSDFVCSRGLLKTLSMTSYDSSSWIFHAVRHKGVIFLCEEETTDKKQYETQMPLHVQKCVYYGYKFEQIMTSRGPRTAVAENGNEMKSVLRATLESSGSNPQHTMMYYAEIDCMDQDNRDVELKTFSSELNSFWVEKKSLFWFIQSYFANISTIYYGQRYYNTLIKVSRLETSTIPQFPGVTWKLDKCLASLSNLLTSVKTNLKNDGTAIKYTFANGAISCQYENINSFPIVPQTFLNQFL